MPKPSRGGQRTRWATAYAQQQPPQTATPQPDDEEEIIDVQPQEVEDAPKPEDIVEEEAKLSYDDIDWDNKKFPNLSQSEYDQIYQDNRDSYYKNGNIINAKKMYESRADTGNGYSYSQNMNHQLNQGLKLDANGKFMSKYLTQGLHPIGKDCTLIRGAHDTLINQILNKCGLKGSYDQYSESQIRQAIVGVEFQTKAFSSFGADNNSNPFIGGSNGGGRELIIHAETASSTKVIAGAKEQQEFITGIGQNARIMDYKLTNDYATPRKGGYKQVAHLFIRQW